MNELELAQMKATYAEKMLRASVNQLDELSRAHADILDTLDDLLDKYAPHNRASVGTQLVAVQRILQDLIAELRRCAKGYTVKGAYAITVEQQLELADWAEARLAAQE